MIRRAFTLAEIVIAATLALLVLGLAAGYLMPALRASTRSATRVELDQRAVIALSRLVREAESTSPAGLSLRSTDPVCVAVNPLEEVRPNGDLIWSESYVIFYFDRARGQLLRRQWPPGDPAPTPAQTRRSKPKKLTPDELADIVSRPAPVSVLARDVTSFSILQSGDDLLMKMPIRFELVMEKTIAGGRQQAERVVYSRTAFTREQR
ncbi:MAG: hypothetical protein AB7S38_22955 [Vulcanimicrobiota bacterium]